MRVGFLFLAGYSVFTYKKNKLLRPGPEGLAWASPNSSQAKNPTRLCCRAWPGLGLQGEPGTSLL